ncbi:alpha-N-acetylglucosaminidase-like [Augochlora pura]
MVNSTLYNHDIVDISRQTLQLAADTIYLDLVRAFNGADTVLFRYSTRSMLGLFDMLEDILSSSKDFLLGTWLRDAKSQAIDDIEEKVYEYDARNQITLWGPRGEIRDYANKQWSGVVADYFKPRWSIFLESLDAVLAKGERLNTTKINEKIFKLVEKPFTFSRKIYPTEPRGDAIESALRIASRWTGTSYMGHKEGTGHH